MGIPEPLNTDVSDHGPGGIEPEGDASHCPPEADEADSNFNPLAPQSVTLEQRTAYVVAAVMALVAVSASVPALWLGRQAWWVPALIFIGWGLFGCVLIWFSHFWPKKVYQNASWRLLDSGMEIRRGVWWKHRIAIPVARVQHVDVSQGPLQRMFDLGKLTIHTAGTANASIELDGLAYGEAMELRNRLIEQKESLDVL
jgi:membrane protein YdbS with pleckstrin-like domain